MYRIFIFLEFFLIHIHVYFIYHLLDLKQAEDNEMASFLNVVQCINEKQPVGYDHLKQVCNCRAEIEDPEQVKQQLSKKGPMKKILLLDFLSDYAFKAISQPVISLLDFGTVWSEIQSWKSEGSEEEFPEYPFEELVERFGQEKKNQV